MILTIEEIQRSKLKKELTTSKSKTLNQKRKLGKIEIYLLLSVDAFVFAATNSTSVNLPVEGFGLIGKPITPGVACG